MGGLSASTDLQINALQDPSMCANDKTLTERFHVHLSSLTRYNFLPGVTISFTFTLWSPGTTGIPINFFQLWSGGTAKSIC